MMRGRADRASVLLIEDGAAIADMYRRQLELDGYEVNVCSSAESALASVEAGAPDIILMDIWLQGMDGIEGLKALNEGLGTKAPPVLVLTNFSDPELMVNALKLGARDYMLKSRTTPAALSNRVRELLAGRTTE